MGARRRDAPELGLRSRRRGRRARCPPSGRSRSGATPAVRAAVAAGCDLPRHDRRAAVHPAACSRSSDAPAARRRGARLTAMGYDFAPGALAGALALDEAGADAVRVDVGYYALGGGPSRCPRARASRSVGRRRWATGFAFRDGRVRSCASRRARALVHGRRASRARRSRSAAPSTSRLPAAYRACARSTCTSAGSGRCARRCRRGRSSASSSSASRWPRPRCVLGRAGRPRSRAPSAGTTPGVAPGSPPRRSTRPEHALRGPPRGRDGYEFTASLRRLGRAAARRGRRRARAR